MRKVTLKSTLWFAGVFLAAIGGWQTFAGYAVGSILMLWWHES